MKKIIMLFILLGLGQLTAQAQELNQELLKNLPDTALAQYLVGHIEGSHGWVTLDAEEYQLWLDSLVLRESSVYSLPGGRRANWFSPAKVFRMQWFGGDPRIYKEPAHWGVYREVSVSVKRFYGEADRFGDVPKRTYLLHKAIRPYRYRHHLRGGDCPDRITGLTYARPADTCWYIDPSRLCASCDVRLVERLVNKRLVAAVDEVEFFIRALTSIQRRESFLLLDSLKIPEILQQVNPADYRERDVLLRLVGPIRVFDFLEDDGDKIEVFSGERVRRVRLRKWPKKIKRGVITATQTPRGPLTIGIKKPNGEIERLRLRAGEKIIIE